MYDLSVSFFIFRLKEMAKMSLDIWKKKMISDVTHYLDIAKRYLDERIEKQETMIEGNCYFD